MARINSRRVVGAALAVAALAGGAVTGCSFSMNAGSKPVVDKGALQKDISERMAKAGQKPQSVTCKDDLPGEVGKTTSCEVVMSETNAFEPIATVTKVEGTTVSYDLSPAVSQEQLQKAVANLVSENSGTKVDSVTCDSGLEGKEGAQASCQVTAGDDTVTRTVDVTKVDGLLMNFTVIPVLARDRAQTSLLDQLEAKLGQRPDSADCSGDLEGKPGNSIDCTVVAGPETQDFTLTVTSVDGDRINYNYAPKG